MRAFVHPHWREQIKMMKKHAFSGLFYTTAIALAVLSAFPAQAQIQDRGDEQLSIRTRENPDYDPQGYRAGDVDIYPSVTAGAKYNDNIYATENNEEGDIIYTARPEVSVRSDFNRHAVNGNAYFERSYYHDNQDENASDYGASVDGRIDAGARTNVPVRVSFDRRHEERGSPDERAGSEPTIYRQFDASVGTVHQGQSIEAKTEAKVSRLVFDDTDAANGGVIDNSDRDRTQYSLYGSVGANSDAHIAPYVYTQISHLDYDEEVDTAGFNRDANEFEVGVGTIYNMSDVSSASVSIGGLHRSFDDSDLDDITGFTYGANVKWEPSPLMAVLFEGDRTIEETTALGASGALTSSGRITIDYELFPNLILQPHIGLTHRKYEGDNDGAVLTTDAGLDATYKMNRNFWINAGYQYVNQDETEESPDLKSYSANIVRSSVKMQF